MHPLRLLEHLTQAIRGAARGLIRAPGFACLCVGILALGIGANTAIFSLVNAVLLRPLPFVEPDRIVVLWEDLSAVGGPDRLEPTPASFVEWRERSRSLEDIATLSAETYNLTGNDEPERVFGARATTNLFSVLGLQPILGRTFAADDEGPGASPVVVINQDLWLRSFGGDPSIVGRTITVDGLGRTVIGVVPSDFKFPDGRISAWFPANFTPDELARRDAYYLYVVARLGSSTTLGQARAEMATISRSIADERGAAESAGVRGVRVVPLHQEIARGSRPTLVILLAAVGAVLLITCANVANLLLVRGTIRQRELALRQAIGAERSHIFGQLLTESVLLGLLGVVLGVTLSTLTFDYLAQLVPGTFPADAIPAIDARVLAFSAVLALVTVLIFGTGPALVAARRDFAQAMKQGVGVTTIASGRARNVLVVCEITLTAILLAAAGLLLRSYSAVLGVDPGFRHENLLIAETPLPPSKYGEAAAREAFYDRALERIAALPGVVDAGYANYAPLTFKGGRVLITIDGQPPPEDFVRNITSDRIVSDDYLRTLGVPLVRGRHLDERDTAEAPLAVIVNEAMVRVHWPNEDPIGARLRIGGTSIDSPWYTVVGVVGDVLQMGLDVPAEPEMYFSLRQSPSPAGFFWPRHLVVRTQGDPMALAADIRGAVWAVDRDQPVSDVRTMSDVFEAELLNRNTQLILITAFAAFALLLAAVGLYGVLAYMVAQRSPEIGVRAALGATRGRIIRGVLNSALGLAAFGTSLGLAGAFVLTRFLESFLFGVSATDPVTFSAVPVAVMLVALAASYVPARRAAHVDPIKALRAD